jgi:hypothetical protein
MKAAFSRSLLLLAGVLAGWDGAAGHELSQPVPVLLERMHDALLLINRGKTDQAYAKALAIQDDFPDTSRGRLIQEVGLRRTAQRLDAAYGTRMAEELSAALERRDVPHLQKTLYSLSFLLILEKLDALDSLVLDPAARAEARAAVVAVAHDYFSHMFERLLKFRAPDRIKALDQLLDRIAVGVRRGDTEGVQTLRREFLADLLDGFRNQLVAGQLEAALAAKRGRAG